MSRLDELIQEYCPDGVEYRKIRDITNYEQPSKYLVKSTDYSDNFKTPVLTAGQTFILGYTNETEGIYPASKKSPVIIFDDFTAAFKWVDFPFKAKSSAMKMITAKENVLFRYLYHLMSFLNYSSDEHKRLWLSIYSDIEIPVPPLPVQQEIVRILDSFTELTAELQAELQARKKQYEFYKEKLLLTAEGDKVQLKDVINSLHTGLNPRKFFVLNTDDATNYYVTIREFKGGYLHFNEKTDKINDEALKLCNNRSNLEVGDLLFSGTGTIGETFVIDKEPYNWNIKEGVYSIKPDISKIDVQYLKHVLTSKKMKDTYEAISEGGTVKSISMKKMETLEFIIPSLEEQKIIANTINWFDALCNDISSGLPAEIEARQKQYEYYRDKLLTFKRLGGDE